MELKTIEGRNIIVWELCSGEVWDKLTENQRSFISYNGSFEMAKKVRTESYIPINYYPINY